MNVAPKLRIWTLQALATLIASAFAIDGATATDLNTLLEDCTACHGKDGASAESEIPIIGGYSAKYLSGSLTNYKNKARPCPQVKFHSGPHRGEAGDMCVVAGRLNDADIQALAGYFAAKRFVRAPQTVDATKAQRGKQIQEAQCKKCHEDGGASADDDAGILAGQWMPYIKHTLEEFGSGQRPLPKKMKPKFDALSNDDKEALVNYFGSFR